MPLFNLHFKPMKKLLFFFALIIAAGCSNAQTNNPPPVIPPYRILNTDSVYITPANLKKHKAVMIIYFSPDCTHCQHLMYEMKPKMAAFKDIQIVMITFTEQLKMIQTFYRDFGLAKYPNIIVGSEGRSYIVAKYYSINSTPYIAIYDKNGKLSKAYEKAPTVDELAKEVKKVG
jgi:thioredoxin-related protein